MPGPRPSFQPVLTPADVAQAELVARRHNAPHAQVRRAQLVLLLAQEPAMTSPEAARQLGLHEQTVRNWRRRWTRDGFSLTDRPRPGRPRRFSPPSRSRPSPRSPASCLPNTPDR